MPVLALSDMAVVGLLALIGTTITMAGTVIVSLLTTKKEAGAASHGVGLLVDRMDKAEAREGVCLDALEWAYDEISSLRRAQGLPVPPRPLALRDRAARDG